MPEPRALGGRRFGDMHRAMVESDVDPSFRLSWLLRETDRWVTENGGQGANTDPASVHIGPESTT